MSRAMFIVVTLAIFSASSLPRAHAGILRHDRGGSACAMPGGSFARAWQLQGATPSCGRWISGELLTSGWMLAAVYGTDAAPPPGLVLARSRSAEFYRGLWEGDTSSWITLGVIVAIILGMAVAQRLGFKIPNKKARREARRRRKHVLWEYERDDD